MALSRLSEATIANIAAGEVISRPARVVSELLDNALDANASRVDIAVDGDGTSRIRVEDDGHGLSRSEAKLAIQRHTTSKLSPDSESLSAVSTLGFRGEALAAICDCATVELRTNDGSEVGTQLRVDDDTTTVDDIARAQGTTVTVTDLFADRPARKESVASPATEFSRISDLVADYALAHPTVAFSLSHDGRKTFSTPGGGLQDALLGVYDTTVARNATVVEHSTAVAETAGELTIRGVLAAPAVTRATAKHVRISVGGRPVAAREIRQAVIDGYGSLLAGDAYPIAAIDIDPPAAVVDPNVHPTKQRVGLSKQDTIKTAVERVVAETLETADSRRAAAAATDLTEPVSAVDRSNPFADCAVIGSFQDLYLLCEADDELLVIDHHAAHERVNYERLQAAVCDEPLPTHSLDPPATLSVSPTAAAVSESHRGLLASLGFSVASFGGGTLRIETVPAPFGRVAEPESLRTILNQLAAGEAPADPREALLAELACHPSLKAGDELSRSDAELLLERLGECEQPFACPHGRPTVCSIDEKTVAEGFDRQQ